MMWPAWTKAVATTSARHAALATRGAGPGHASGRAAAGVCGGPFARGTGPEREKLGHLLAHNSGLPGYVEFFLHRHNARGRFYRACT